MTNGTKERVGIIGVGRMGLAMLKHLVKHGYAVTACDISAEQLAKARAAGAATADSAAALGKACDFVILGVGYTDEVEAVVYGDNGLLATLPKGSIIAVSSTVSPATVQAINQAAKPKSIGVLDAPICRGRFAADEGTLLAMVGGAPDVVERGRAVYRAFCSDYAHLGEVGHGQVGKTMNNLLLWISAVGLRPIADWVCVWPRRGAIQRLRPTRVTRASLCVSRRAAASAEGRPLPRRGPQTVPYRASCPGRAAHRTGYGNGGYGP